MNRFRSVVVLGLGACVSGLVTMTVSQPLFAEQPAIPVGIRGKGTAQLAAQLVEWQNTLFSAEQPVDLAYLSRGSDEGRADLLRGAVDFTIGGIPFSNAELTQAPEGSGELIAAPVSVGSLAIVFTTPPPSVGGWNTYSEDQACLDEYYSGTGTVLDPEECVTRGVFEGPFRAPPENLASVALGIEPSVDPNHYSAWSSPSWLAATGATDLQIAYLPNNRHTFVNRTEGSATNKYLLEYFKAMAPVTWEFATTVWQPDDPANPFDYAWDPVPSRLSARSVSRFGADTQMGLMAIASSDVKTGGLTPNFTGNAGAIPATMVGQYFAQYPSAGFRVMEIQNANGDWVTPTPESVAAAIAVDSAPNAAATSAIPGAYPLVWVNRLYTFGGTLEPEQANALAASIRYIATDGQAAVIADGGAALTGALVAEALAAANRVVETNCPTATHVITVGGSGPLEPATPQLATLAGLAHCEARVAATTTTTTTISPTTTTSSTTSTTTTTTIAAITTTVAQSPVTTVRRSIYVPPASQGTTSGGSGSTSSATRSSTAVVDDVSDPDDRSVETSTVVEDEAPPTTEPAVPVASEPTGLRLGRGLNGLPIVFPDDGTGGFKKLGTFVLGAVMFLAARALVRARGIAA